MQGIIQRGTPNLLKSIQQSAKKVSESKGISESMSLNGNVRPSTPEAGAYASIQKMNIPETGAFASMQRVNATPVPGPSNVVPRRMNESKLLKDRLFESVETLGTTGEYFNAASSLLTLYALGELTEGVLNTMSREDLNEVRGIIREFKGILDSY